MQLPSHDLTRECISAGLSVRDLRNLRPANFTEMFCREIQLDDLLTGVFSLRVDKSNLAEGGGSTA